MIPVRDCAATTYCLEIEPSHTTRHALTWIITEGLRDLERSHGHAGVAIVGLPWREVMVVTGARPMLVHGEQTRTSLREYGNSKEDVAKPWTRKYM